MNERSVSVNGISIYSLTNPNLRSFCLSLYVRAGSIFEDLYNNGISHLFEHVVFRNIKNKYENFYELLAMHGLCFQGSTYKKFVSFTIDGPQHEFDFAIVISIMRKDGSKPKSGRKMNGTHLIFILTV